MYKHILKALTTIASVVILASACTATSDESIEAEQAQVKTKQVAECIVVPPKEPVACTMQYDPVCGCDGKTYGNACSARGAGVPSSTPGACEKGSID